MLVKSYMDTYKFPANITNCSNNYGPYQFPEKLIPLIINNALQGKKLPVYGDGKNVRDWLYVMDHAKGIDMYRKREDFSRHIISVVTTKNRTFRSSISFWILCRRCSRKGSS